MPGDPASGEPVDPRRDCRLHAVPWRDLATLSPAAAAKELLLLLPWLALSLALANAGLYPAALAMSFLFFLTGLRVVHGAYHYALGLPRRSTEWVMVAFGVLMLGSMHAIQWNHLQHHRRCLARDDIEAMGARRSALGAYLLPGPWLSRRRLDFAAPGPARRQCAAGSWANRPPMPSLARPRRRQSSPNGASSPPCRRWPSASA